MSELHESCQPYKSIYNDIPHKRLEFWHKSIFLAACDIDSAALKIIGEKENIYKLGKSAKRWHPHTYSSEGGSCRINMKKSKENQTLLKNIKNNIESSRKSCCVVDAILRNKNTNNFLELSMISGVQIQKEESVDCLSLFFFSIRLHCMLGTC